jgi:hypothetical protein
VTATELYPELAARILRCVPPPTRAFMADELELDMIFARSEAERHDLCHRVDILRENLPKKGNE